MFVYPPETAEFFPCFRYRAAKAKEAKGQEMQFYSFQEFLALLSVDETWLATTAYPQVLADKLQSHTDA